VLDEPLETVGQVALRVEQKPGVYAGAAILEPVKFKCGPTHIPLGDWCDHALEGYSGGAVYSKMFRLEMDHLMGKVILDFGMVNTTVGVTINGQSVGVGMGRPYRFDITKYVHVGENRLEATVYNTLANHYAVGELPKDFVFQGQTLSGLIGPVTLQFLGKVTLVAMPIAHQ
jgi:hypothetical protein